MRTSKITARLTIALALLSSVEFCAAQQDDEMVQWMKTAAQMSDRLRKSEKKTGTEVASAAERLGGIYENMIHFWRQRGADDAVKLSMQGKATAAVLANAAHEGDEAKAAEALKSLIATCKPCHDAHRERIGENKYRIK